MFLSALFLFLLGVLLYTASGLVLLYAYWTRDSIEKRLILTHRVLFAGALSFLLALLARGITTGKVPLTRGGEWLTLFIAVAGATACVLARSERRRGLLLFYVPPLVALTWLATLSSARDYMTVPEKDLSPVLLLLHVVPAAVGYALCFVAGVTSAAYMDLVRRLKRRQDVNALYRFPSLEEMDGTMQSLITAGYLVFAATFVLGMFWAWYQRELLSSAWWFSPKVLLSSAMVVFFAGNYHARVLGWLRGPKSAYTVFLGFVVIFGVYSILELFDLTNYNFWGNV
jgi:ABC-type transport system involved in cytochrome c biogenesis permease subunit